MKIHKTKPEAGPQWASDSPQIKGMRAALPVVALLSAVSLAGGLSSFIGLSFLNFTGIAVTFLLVIAALRFDAIGINAGQSIVREFILIDAGKLNRLNWVGWLNIGLSVLVCISVCFSSFTMSKDGIGYLVINFREAKEVRANRDTMLSAVIHKNEVKSNNALAAITSAYQSKVEAINAKWNGKINAYRADIDRKEARRTKDNSGSIDRDIAYYNKLIGRAEENRGKELTEAAAKFEADQQSALSKSDTLSIIAIEQAKAENKEFTALKAKRAAEDAKLSTLVSYIFSWSVVLMLFIACALTVLETRNGILPNPILSDSDLSGATSVSRLLLSVPAFLHSCMLWGSEKLYQLAPKHPTPTIDNDLVNYAATQLEVTAKRKESSGGASKEEVKILKEVKAAESGDVERKVNAFELIAMYLQTDDKDEINAFYMRCVSFVSGMGANPFHERKAIGFVTNGGRNSSYNELRYSERNANGFSENTAAKVPEGHKVCEQCRTVYQPNVSRQKFCSNVCRSAYHRERGGHEREYLDRHKS